jgi:uncharacterized protein YggU (UPF0235/DUF167 family)
MTFWQTVGGGVKLGMNVQLTSRRSGAAAAKGMRLRIGLAEPAEGGRANRPACVVGSPATLGGTLEAL